MRSVAASRHVSPCTSTGRMHIQPSHAGSTRLVWQHHPQLRFAVTIPRAGEEQSPPSTSTRSADDDLAEQRIEALEASSKRAGTKARRSRPIPIRGVNQPEAIDPESQRAEWKEGQLFPEGWDQMDPLEKATELYLGKRGILFWASQAAWYSVWILLGGWVFFRFIGPALGIYKLAADVSSPV